jgi:penicillin-binding protein 2
VAVIVEHGGLGGATAGAPRAREVMRVALMKDPELRSRIETPMPMPEAPEPLEAEGVAPEAPTITAAPAAPAAPGTPPATTPTGGAI